MENTREDIEAIKHYFKICQKTLNAIGDETRQYLILMMLTGPCNGSRVVDIAKKTNLSRPAISHHMQILKSAEIVKSRKEGTMIYYYIDPDNNKTQDLINLLTCIQEIMKNIPDRSGEE